MLDADESASAIEDRIRSSARGSVGSAGDAAAEAWRTGIKREDRMADVKACFYAIQRHIRAKQEHFARVAVGASCEQWFNAEACVALNWPTDGVRVLRDSESALVEDRKRDIIVRTKRQMADGEVERISHTVEVKLVYPWRDRKLEVEKLGVLRDQLLRPPLQDEEPEVVRIGLVVAVWLARADGERFNAFYLAAEPSSQFFERVQDRMRKIFDPETTFTTQHGYSLERLIQPRQTVTLGGDDYEVEAGATYFTRRRG